MRRTLKDVLCRDGQRREEREGLSAEPCREGWGGVRRKMEGDQFGLGIHKAEPHAAVSQWEKVRISPTPVRAVTSALPGRAWAADQDPPRWPEGQVRVQPVEAQPGTRDPQEPRYPHFRPHTPCLPPSFVFLPWGPRLPKPEPGTFFLPA